jgi:hypothetical protein
MATNLQFIKSASGSDVSTLNITNCFSASYDVYQINIVEYINSDLSDFFVMKFIDSGGSVISDSEYDSANLNMRMYTFFSQNRYTNNSSIQNIGYSQSNSTSSTANTINIFNPFDSSSFTFVKWQGVLNVHGFGGAGAKAIGVHKSAEQITGVSFEAGNSINSIKVNVFGVK